MQRCEQCDELLAALKLAKLIGRPWIDGAIKRAVPNHVPLLTFEEWDAACEQVDRVIAKMTTLRRGEFSA